MSSTDSDSEDLPRWVIAAQKFEGLSGRTASFEKEQERKRQEEEKRSLRARVEAQRTRMAKEAKALPMDATKEHVLVLRYRAQRPHFCPPRPGPPPLSCW